VGVMLAPVAAHAEVNARVEISAAVAGSSATLEAIERQANARDRARQAEIAALQTRLTEAEARGAAEVSRLQAELIAARESLVVDLASRDTAYAEEIAVFRREVTDIAATAEGAAALARYNAGDRVGAIAVLDRLRRARDAGRQNRADIQSGAEARRIAILAMNARNFDMSVGTAEVISRYEEIVSLDPREFSDWLSLSELYIESGRYGESLRAIEHVQNLTNDDFIQLRINKSRAYILQERGSYAEAHDIHNSNLAIVERLYSENSSSSEVTIHFISILRDVSISYLTAGEFDDALNYSQKSINLAAQFSERDPESVEIRLELHESLVAMGDIEIARKNSDSALSIYKRALDIAEYIEPATIKSRYASALTFSRIGDIELSRGSLIRAGQVYWTSEVILEQLYNGDMTNYVYASSYAVALAKFGQYVLSDYDDPNTIYFSTRDPFISILSRSQRSLDIFEALYSADPESASRASNLRQALEISGDLLMSRGDRSAALSRYSRSLEIAERLFAVDPASLAAIKSLASSCLRMAGVTDEVQYSQRLISVIAALKAREQLSAEDILFVSQIEEALAGLGQRPE